MAATDALRQDHRLVARVLDGLGDVARRLAAGGAVAPRLLDAAIDFFDGFVERCHFAKEEEALIPALYAQAHRLDDPSLAALRGGYARCRQLLDALRRAVAGKANGKVPPGLAEPLASYVAAMRRHLEQEERVLYARADAMPADVEGRMQSWCDAVEQRELPGRARRAAEQLAEALIQASRADHSPRTDGPRVAADVMRTGIARLSPDDSLAKAAGLMDALGVRELPVVEGERLVGIVTRRDLDAHRGHFEWTSVRTAMTAEPVTVSPETSSDAIAQLLLARCFNAVPVVAGGAFLGMVARSDLLHLLL